MTTTTTFIEDHELESRIPVELIIFGLAMVSVFALVLAPHRIGLGF